MQRAVVAAARESVYIGGGGGICPRRQEGPRGVDVAALSAPMYGRVPVSEAGEKTKKSREKEGKRILLYTSYHTGVHVHKGTRVFY